MTKTRVNRILIAAILLCAGGLVFQIVARPMTFKPDLSDAAAFETRAQRQLVDGVAVSASALGARESRRFFGEDLAKHDIQPLWLSIENNTDDQLIYLQIATDPDYYSPYEVSYRFHGALSYQANRARDEFFLSHQIANVVPPHSRTTGFMYGVLDAGVKYVRVLIAGNDSERSFDFVLPVPGAAFVGANVETEAVYPGKTIEDLDLSSLREKLANYPCCTTNSDGKHDGDPLNLVVVEGKDDLLTPFVVRDWHLAQKLDAASAIETARAFVLRGEYPTSPVSPLYVFGRREDVALQKARSTINERIHARMWLTPYTFESRRVWIGQVSRDVGVRLTDQVWNLTTHKIGPDVDFDRGYLLQDLVMSGSVEQYGFVKGVTSAQPSAPRTNLTGDPYYTDGLRAVLFLTNRTTSLSQIRKLPWEVPPLPGEEMHADCRFDPPHNSGRLRRGRHW